MNSTTLPPAVHDCLQKDMQVDMDHFYIKYDSFDNSFKEIANKLLLSYLNASNQPSPFNDIAVFYEDGDDEQNEFLQAMFDCFKCYQTLEGIELIKDLYSHVNRGGNAWFPVVILHKPFEDYSKTLPNNITIYRGCDKIEYETDTIHQSWTTDFDTAKRYAYEYFHGIDKSKRIVLKANVFPTQIVWLRTIDNEVVLKPNSELSDLELLERYN